MAHSSSRTPRPIAWLERGLPRELLVDAEARRRGLLIAGTIGLVVVAALATLPLLAGRPASLAAPIAATTLALAGLWSLRRGRARLAGHLVVAAPFVALVLAATAESSQLSLALVAIPPLAAQAAGRLALHAWSGLSIAAVAYLLSHEPRAAVVAALALLAVHLLSWLGEQTREQAVARAELVGGQLARADQEVERTHRVARKAAAASAAKSAYLATMSHELRNPLSAVIGYAEVLAEDAQGRGLSQMRDDLIRIAAAGQHLRGLVEDILDLAPRDTERPEQRRERVSAEQLVYDVTCALEPLARRRQNVLEVVFDGAPAVAELDRERVRQVLVYLVDNALTFTAQGRVTVRLRAEDDGSRRVLVFVVEDTGLGIAEADLAQLFEPRSHSSSAGLALSLCKQLVTAMGGTIAVRSQLGRGSAFTVRLPAGPSARAEPPALDVAC